MNEALLYHLWKYRLFKSMPLTTIDGKTIEVIKPGELNPDSGPDFFNARLIIDGTEWAGNVEIDPTSADWYNHKHHINKDYSKLILHIVYELNKPLDHGFPVLEFKNFMDEGAVRTFHHLQESPLPIPCSKQIKQISDITLNTWLERMIIERLEQKTAAIHDMLQVNKFDWEETFYFFLARNFGFKTNALPFEMLARSIPMTALARHKNNLLQIEALLFGQAGFLSDKHADEYVESLRREYRFLAGKFQMKPMNNSLWKFARMHPRNFPSVRIAQFASLIHNSTHLFSKILEEKDVKSLIQLFSFTPSSYWDKHFHFGKESAENKKTFGRDSADNIIINTIAPFLFLYGKIKDNEKLTERALSLLEHIKPENNVIIRQWKSAGITAKHAYHTQALIQLKNLYCSKKKCLSCAIGVKILNNKSNDH